VTSSQSANKVSRGTQVRINKLLAGAFGCYGVGAVAFIAGVLAPTEVPVWGRILAFFAMVVLPLGVVAVLRRYPHERIPPVDTDTLINVAGLLVTAGGFNLIPILNWATEISKTQDGWLMLPTPKPDLTWPSITFTLIALILAVVALYRGLTDPTRKFARLTRERQEFQQAKGDLLRVVKRMHSADDVAELKIRLGNLRDPKNSKDLHDTLNDFLAGLSKRSGTRSAIGHEPRTRRLTKSKGMIRRVISWRRPSKQKPHDVKPNATNAK